MASTASTNWHLFTVTFDPAFDTPTILKSYAERYKADPARWSFLTGDLVEIGALSDQFGQKFWREEGALNHNLRTVVIDATGKVQQIFQGNSWTADDLVAELQRAVEAK
jgi:protein SCO1/2